TVPGDAAQHPRQLRVLRHVALHEQRGPLHVDAHRDQLSRRPVRTLAQRLRIVLDRDRVQVDDAVERLEVVLQGDPLPQSPYTVAEGELVGRRLDTRQHTGTHDG